MLHMGAHEFSSAGLMPPARREATIERLERILRDIKARRMASLAARNLIELSAESERFDERRTSALPQFQEAIGLCAPDGGMRLRIPKRRVKAKRNIK